MCVYIQADGTWFFATFLQSAVIPAAGAVDKKKLSNVCNVIFISSARFTQAVK